MHPENAREFLNRRQWLWSGGAGFGALALGAMEARGGVNPSAARAGNQSARAKRVIFLFMEGGPSHIDTFDPKPLLNKLAGQKLPQSFGTVVTSMGTADAPLLASQRKWKQHGQGGLWVSDWLPNIAQRADDLVVVRSVWCDAINHSAGVCQMNTGATMGGRPSLGSWVLYGLGSENENLPGFVVLTDGSASVTNGARNWGAGFMPAAYQGAKFETTGPTLPGMAATEKIAPERQSRRGELLGELNRAHALRSSEDTELAARIASQELAFRMQAAAPEAVDLTHESPAIRALYGIDRKETANFGKMCLMARRLAERGVRFIQLYSGAGSRWDAHANIEKNHTLMCGATDHPVAGLLTDLKQRGLLEDTLVVWGGEFGRTPMSEKGDGRDHNPWGFTMFLAGAGLKGGRVVGTTDELGLRAVDHKLHVHDFHATILALLGLDHEKVLWRHKGRPERPTVNEGITSSLILG